MGRIVTVENLLGFVCLTLMLVMTAAQPLRRTSAALGSRASFDKRPWLFWTAFVLFARVCFLALVLRLALADSQVMHLAGSVITFRELLFVGLGSYLISRAVIHLNSALYRPVARNDEPVPWIATLVGSLPHALDGAILAMGMTDEPVVMVAAVFAAAGLVFVFRDSVGALSADHRAVNTLSLAFVILVSLLLVVEGIAGGHLRISKTYLYFAIAFAFGVQLMSMRRRGRVLK